ncbi:MAG: HU family DNA-binding protein [bacterium]
MNKTELTAAVAEKSGLTKVDAKKAVDAIFESIQEALTNQDPVAIIGFGTFSVVERGERQGINPATKQTITIPACRKPKFKAGASLVAAVK